MTRYAAMCLLSASASCALGLALAIAETGGMILDLAGWRVSLRSAWRPLVAGGLLAAATVWLARPSARSGAAGTRASDRAAPSSGAGPAGGSRLAVAVSALAGVGLPAVVVSGIVKWLIWRVPYCGGADSYGYVSAAALFGRGSLSQAEPLAALLPWDRAIEALTPLGWLPAPAGPHIVPLYPPGLPIVMAVGMVMAGPDAPFWIAPLGGVLLLVATYALARAVAGRHEAWLATALVAVHPIVTIQAIQPMSDVPAAAALTGALTLLVRARPWPATAGALAVLALLMRPLLVLPAVAAVLFLGASARGERRRYLAPLVAGAAALALFHWHQFGSPLRTGYGAADDVFVWSRLAGNALVFLTWSAIVQTPLAFVALGAGIWRGGLGRFARVSLGVFVAGAAPYLLHERYDHWEVLRFWLPVLPPLVVIAARGIFVATASSSHRAAVQPAVALIAALAAAAGAALFLRSTAAPGLRAAESRYALVGEWIARHSTSDAVVLAALHSGSVRYYAGRVTLRWERIPADRLAATVDALAARGRPVLLVHDDPDEERAFLARFPEPERAGLHIRPVVRLGRPVVHVVERAPAPPGA